MMSLIGYWETNVDIGQYFKPNPYRWYWYSIRFFLISRTLWIKTFMKSGWKPEQPDLKTVFIHRPSGCWMTLSNTDDTLYLHYIQYCELYLFSTVSFICTKYLSTNNIQHPMYVFKMSIFQCLPGPSAVCKHCTC